MLGFRNTYVVHNTNLFQMEKFSDDSDTDDDSKFPVGPLQSTTFEPYEMGGPLFDEDIVIDTTSAAGNNNTVSVSNRAGPSQEISWREDESYK